MPVDRSSHGRGASGKHAAAAARLPPCKLRLARSCMSFPNPVLIMPVPQTLLLTLAALALEAGAGYPAFVYRRIGHPVTWIGGWLACLERHLNQARFPPALRRGLGALALGLLLGVAAVAALALAAVLGAGMPGFVALALIASSLIAQRSLDEHVRAVALALESGGLPAGRQAVSMIVGRNPDVLDEAGVCRAAIESLAENFSDGIVAPVFWMAFGGLLGAALYKAANTADSMIGHRSARYRAFGWAAARFDDCINLPASRLAALWLVLAACVCSGASPKAACASVWRDASRHRSPNAGWPEAAMAGALGLQLAGPRVYDSELVPDVCMGHGRRNATASDIFRALRLYRLACLIQFLALAAIALLFTAPM